MATVLLAFDPKHERRVAIKLLRPEVAAAVGAERFLREIRIAARLRHPHILPLYDSGEAAALLYYVMPFVEGETLRDRLVREKQLPVDAAVRIALEVADALGYAHGEGVVHRDIKPENILLGAGHATVTDFGIARAVSAGDGSLTTTGLILGTPAYLSPEQAAGDAVDGRSDVYGLACVLYEMVAGRPPFTGVTIESVVHQHLAAPPPEIGAVRPGAPAGLAAVLRRALAKAPADRFRTAGEMAVALGTVAPGGAAPGASRPVHPARVAAWFALASAAVLGAVYGLVHALGLPDWVLVAAGVLLMAGLPAVLLTGLVERRRAAGLGTPVTGVGGALHRALTWRGAVLGGVAAFAALGVGVTAYTAMRALGIGPVGTLLAAGVLADRERLVLADFVNRTSDTTLGATVTELIRVGLGQSPVVNVLESARVGEVLARMERDPATALDLGLAREVAEREGIKAIVAGEIGAVGNGYAISVRVLRPSGEVLTSRQEAAASADGIIAAVDRLSGKIRERIGESLRSIRASTPLAQVTTSSLEALRLYSQAVRAGNEGDVGRATGLLEQAVALDTTFAMAYRQLGIILGNLGEQPARRAEVLGRAYAHRDRLTEEERYRAIGSYHLAVTHDREQAIAAFRSLHDRIPDDASSLTNLSVLYWQLRDYPRALEFAERALALDSSSAAAFWNVAEINLAVGQDAAADEALRRFTEMQPGNPLPRILSVAIATARGEYDAAERELRVLSERQRGSAVWVQNTHQALADLDVARGRLRDAAADWEPARGAIEERGLEGEYLKQVLGEALAEALVRRDADAAVRLADAALARHPLERLTGRDRPYERLATLYAVTGRLGRARAVLTEYEREVRSAGDRDAEAPLARARGWMALAEGRGPDAVAAFRRADVGECRICALPGLARAYDLAGEPDSAIVVYERYVTTPWLTRLGDADALFLAGALRRLGELHEERGNRDAAVEYYNRYLDLWRDAEPELQSQVSEVRRRLAGLVGEEG